MTAERTPDGVRVGSVVLDVTDIAAGIGFWTAALGYVADPPDPEEDPQTFCVLRDPDQRRANVSMQLTDTAGRSQRVHLDLYTYDLPGEVARLQELGARIDGSTPSDEDHTVMLDPFGNVFCVCGSFVPD